MKPIFTFIFILALYFNASAQFGSGSMEEIKKLKNTTLSVVLSDDNKAYNEAIKKAIVDKWCFTYARFVTEKEYQANWQDTKYSFLRLMPLKSKDKLGEKVSTTNLCLLPIGKIKASFGPEDVTVSSNMNLFNRKALQANVLRSVEMIEGYVEGVAEVSCGRESINEQCVRYTRSGKELLNNLTLYIAREDMSIKKLDEGEEAAMLSPYPFKAKLVEQDEINQAILRADPKIAYAGIFFAGGQRIRYIARAKDSKVLFARQVGQMEKSGDQISAKFLKELSE
jgi:hypothetical protein